MINECIALNTQNRRSKAVHWPRHTLRKWKNVILSISQQARARHFDCMKHDNDKTSDTKCINPIKPIKQKHQRNMLHLRTKLSHMHTRIWWWLAGWLTGWRWWCIGCTYPMFKCDECLHDLLFVINDADLLNTILCPAGVYFVSPFFSILLSFCPEFRLFQFDFIEKICVLYCQWLCLSGDTLMSNLNGKDSSIINELYIFAGI